MFMFWVAVLVVEEFWSSIRAEFANGIVDVDTFVVDETEVNIDVVLYSFTL